MPKMAVKLIQRVRKRTEVYIIFGRKLRFAINEIQTELEWNTDEELFSRYSVNQKITRVTPIVLVAYEAIKHSLQEPPCL